MKKQPFHATIVVIVLGVLVIAYLKKISILVPVALVAGAVAFLIPALGMAIHSGWMKLSLALGFVSSRILLTVIYILVLLPLSALSKLFRKKTSEVAEGAQSFYKTRDHLFVKKDLENLW